MNTLERELAGAFAERWLAAWNSGRPDPVAALCAVDVVYEDVMRPEPLRGRDEVRAFVASLMRAFPDLRVTQTQGPFLAAVAPRAIVPVRVAGTFAAPLDPPGFGPTGGPVVIDAHHEWELDGARVARFRALYDVHEIARQIGAGPPAGSRMEAMGVRLQRLGARRLRRENARAARGQV
jgi:steroid delta-isomerase-like uncharacterized protein